MTPKRASSMHADLGSILLGVGLRVTAVPLILREDGGKFTPPSLFDATYVEKNFGPDAAVANSPVASHWLAGRSGDADTTAEETGASQAAKNGIVNLLKGFFR